MAGGKVFKSLRFAQIASVIQYSLYSWADFRATYMQSAIVLEAFCHERDSGISLYTRRAIYNIA
jgi:hypothetical protein